MNILAIIGIAGGLLCAVADVRKRLKIYGVYRIAFHSQLVYNLSR